MLYTSYFAKMKSLPADTVCISICAKAPTWYHGIEYKKIAPRYGFFMQWKQDHDDAAYLVCYHEQVLGKLTPKQVLDDIYRLIPNRIKDKLESDEYDWWENPNYHIALLCYEKSTDFCHRHPWADWMTEGGYTCVEYVA